MIQALWSASSGMLAQQMSMDTIGNNLANINTNGYKKTRIEFQDLMYNTQRTPNRVTRFGQVLPFGIQTGTGVRPASTQMIFEQGPLVQTGNNKDLALSGNAFFEIIMPDGSRAYTRDGSFNIDADGNLVTQNGYLSSITAQGGGLLKFPNTEASNLKIDSDGKIFQETPLVQLEAMTFTDPSKLTKIEDGVYIPTEDSGDPITLAEAKQQDIDNAVDENGDPIQNPVLPEHQAYYQITLESGETAYTTENQFKITEEGNLVTANKGYALDPEVTVNLVPGDSVLKAGTVLGADAEGVINHATEMGRINVVSFTNPAGLQKIGGNLYRTTNNSGAATSATDFTLNQGFTEGSNVQVAEEMVNMMLVQRAYELNSKSIKNSDDMLGVANSLLKR